MFASQYGAAFDGTAEWQSISGGGDQLYPWDEFSTYIQEPPYFAGLTLTPDAVQPVAGARVLGLFGDSITTDHISPAGDIALNSPAGRWLEDHDVAKEDFNQYGARRGNDKIMTRGTFANIRLKNQLVPGTEGGVTRFHGTGETMAIFDAAQKYKETGTQLVVLAGKEYGTGSSRDWAAKGSALLGVRAVIAESYERIHRNNLVGMGVLPCQFLDGQSWESLGLKGDEAFDIPVGNDVQARQRLTVTARRPDGGTQTFEVIARLDTPVEVNYYLNGGILQTVLRKMAS
jgi:aconitate hydratase